MVFSTLTAGLYFTFHQGPKLESPYLKYALAGSTATVFCGVTIHGLDTLNMKSKIIDGNKVYVLELLRRKGLKELYRGVVPLYYGMMISAFAYYYLYSWMRERLRNKYQADNQDLKKTLMIASAASFVAEGVAFTIYYPLDLIKTRMQTAQKQFGYRNIVHGVYRIFNETPSSTYPRRIRNFYKGASFYSMAYLIFTAIEFSLFETILKAIELKTLQNPQSHDHNILHIILSAFIAGSFGGFVTNPLEVLAVNKMTQPKFRAAEMIFGSKRQWYDLVFRGSLFRISYMGLQTSALFFMLHELTAMMGVDITELEE